MDVIEVIEIENFEPYKSVSLELHPGFNVITGTSDIGKSSFMRAIRWPLQNTPGDFTSDFATSKDICRVAMQFSDGYVIRQRVDGINTYSCGNDEGDFESDAVLKKHFYMVQNFQFQLLL